MSTHATVPDLTDPHLPAFEDMLGAGALEMLQAALGDPGAQVVSAKRSHVTWVPGRSAEVRYDALVESEAGSRRLDLVAATGSRVTGVPARRVHRGESGTQGASREVAVWQVAEDPLLPGLRAALEPDAVRALLAQTGVPPAPVHLRMRAYRPLRRAVVEARTGAYRLFLKVVPPQEAAALQDRHREVARYVPAPASHGWSPDHGILVLRALPGHDLRETVMRGAPAPSPEDLAAVLSVLPALPDGRPARSGLRTALGHVPLLQALAPAEAHLVEALGRGLRALPPVTTSVPVHGDYHAGQVLVEGGRVAGLLDLDTVGLGDPVGDWATLIAQFVTSTDLAPTQHRPALRSYTDRLLRYAEEQHGSDLLAAHVAGNILGLATGPFRVQMDGWQAETVRRLHLAAAWARRAGISVGSDVGEERDVVSDAPATSA